MKNEQKSQSAKVVAWIRNADMFGEPMITAGSKSVLGGFVTWVIIPGLCAAYFVFVLNANLNTPVTDVTALVETNFTRVPMTLFCGFKEGCLVVRNCPGTNHIDVIEANETKTLEFCPTTPVATVYARTCYIDSSLGESIGYPDPKDYDWNDVRKLFSIKNADEEFNPVDRYDSMSGIRPTVTKTQGVQTAVSFKRIVTPNSPGKSFSPVDSLSLPGESLVILESDDPAKWIHIKRGLVAYFPCINSLPNNTTFMVSGLGSIIFDSIMVQRIIEYQAPLDAAFSAIGNVGGVAGILTTFFGLVLPRFLKSPEKKRKIPVFPFRESQSVGRSASIEHEP